MGIRRRLRAVAVSVSAAAITWATPAAALAAKYMDVHADKQVTSDDPVIAKTMIEVVQMLLTTFLLPIAILISVWRSMYYAIFCVLAHTDPLHLLNERNLSMIRQTTGTSMKARTQQRRQRALESSTPAFGDFETVEPEIGVAALKDELRRTARSLIVVFCVWSFIQIIIYLVTFFLGIVENS